MRKIFVLLCICMLLFAACNSSKTALTEAEKTAFTEITGASAESLTDVTKTIMDDSRTERYPAIQKIYETENEYLFIVSPIGYNGPITCAVVLDKAGEKIKGLRITEEAETDHYVRNYTEDWFVGRFKEKSDYLSVVKLDAENDDQIVAITGATVTTEGVVNGVNAVFAVYREYTKGIPGIEIEKIPKDSAYRPE